MVAKTKRVQPHRSAVGRVFVSRTAKGVLRFRIGPHGERIPEPLMEPEVSIRVSAEDFETIARTFDRLD